MAIADADIIVYGCATMPLDDTTQQIGGAIDTEKEVVFTDIDPAGTVEMLSDGADTRTLTIYHINAAGVLVSEVQTLDGVNVVAFSGTMGAIWRMLLSATSASRTVTVRKSSAGATLATIKVNRKEIRRPCYDAIANATGGATKKFYDKVFFKNTHASLDLASAVIKEQADPNSVMAFMLDGSLDGSTDNGAGNTRLTAPSGTFNSSDKNVANSGVLTHGTAQAVWLELTLVAGVTPADTSFTLRLSGVSG